MKSYKVFEDIINEMIKVYKHDDRPWLIGYSGGKDSTLLVSLVFKTVLTINPLERKKKIFIVTSDTGVENPIVGRYMHNSCDKINDSSTTQDLGISSTIIYPDVNKSFWSLVIGLGYPTPEAPGFRWCTEKLKINPMNKFTNEIIDKYGEVILLLGVRKDESITRARTITAREIEGKLLVPHNDIEKAYVYNPLTKVENSLVWEYLLSNEGISPWGTDLKYLFNLYQGEDMGEEQSVIGEVDKEKIPVTGNSRFGCWCCTIVKEDKSLQKFIDNGSPELIPLRDFRNWLVSIRKNRKYREERRRNGSVYYNSEGEKGLGAFTLSARREILEKLLLLQKNSGFNLITLEELKKIDELWELEGDLSRRMLVDTYFSVYGEKLPWDEYRVPMFTMDIIDKIKKVANKNKIPFELITKLLIAINKDKNYVNEIKMQKSFEQILNQGWLHADSILEGLNNNEN